VYIFGRSILNGCGSGQIILCLRFRVSRWRDHGGFTQFGIQKSAPAVALGMERVGHHGRETAYRVGRPGADGPTALYVHGSGGTHRVWAHQYGPNGPIHPAVALDLSGHGASDDVSTTPGAETLGAYVEDVASVARETGADVLVGNSLGGAVVLQSLLERSLPVEAAVLLGSGAKLTVADELQALLAEDFERAVDVLHGPDRLFHDAEEQTRERSMATMRGVGRAVTERDFLTCHTFDVRDRLEEVSVPMLALVGEHDGLTPPSYHEYLAAESPNGECTLLADCAHLAMLERPAAVSRAVEEFVASLS
jgi:pimeloyl-ACP methyl ester carboxylesterase